MLRPVPQGHTSMLRPDAIYFVRDFRIEPYILTRGPLLQCYCSLFRMDMVSNEYICLLPGIPMVFGPVNGTDHTL